MEVFRIARQQYAKKLTASGAAARWNRDNQFVIYSGEARSLSTLELVVHKQVNTALLFEVMVISIADEKNLIKKITVADLPSDWRTVSAYTQLQDIGSKWYTEQEFLVLQVPSVIVPEEHNFIINTTHPDFSSKVSLARREPFFWDERLK